MTLTFDFGGGISAGLEARGAMQGNVGASPGGGGTTDHTKLVNRDRPAQHPMVAIDGLLYDLDTKIRQDELSAITNIELEEILK